MVLLNSRNGPTCATWAVEGDFGAEGVKQKRDSSDSAKQLQRRVSNRGKLSKKNTMDVMLSREESHLA